MNKTDLMNKYAKLKEWYKRIAAFPSKDYPPAQLAKCIRICEEVGRKDLGQQIMDAWNRCFEKHAGAIMKSRTENSAWAAASVIGANSIKKNVFGGKDFGTWLESQKKDAPAKSVSEAKKIDVTEPPKGVPAIAIPKPNETVEDWSAQAEETKKKLEQIKTQLQDNQVFVSMLEKTISELKRKIGDYGPGGPKAVTKAGKPHKFSERVKSWEAELSAYETKLSETKSSLEAAKKKFTVAEANYKTNPACTVEYEKKAQESLEGVLEVLLNMKDLEKQKDMLEKFNGMMKKIKKGDGEGESGSKAASLEKEAAFLDSLVSAFDSIVGFFTSAWKSLLTWVKSLFVAVDKFDKVATELGRY